LKLRAALSILTLGALACAPGVAAADDDRGLPSWVQEITLHGYLSSSYSYNFNRPPSAVNQFRVFDFDDNTFKLDELELVAQKDAAKPREAGFRADFTFGSSVPRVTASAGLFRDDTGKAQDIDIHQAFADYVVPLGSGLRLDLGKFVTSPGYEVIDGYDGWNDNATRSFLFGYAIPFTHVGLRGTYHFSERVAGTAMVVNGWDVARDNNTAKTIGGQVAWTPGGSASVTMSGLAGAEEPGNNADWRDLLDVVAIVRPASRWTLGANGDWGKEAGAAGPGQAATWSGAALYVRFAACSSFALAARGEVFDDLDGFRTGVSQTLREVTLTPEKRVTDRLYLRGDLRFDRSSKLVFQKPDGSSKTQSTVLVSAFFTF
jgi:hypothetical protein